MKKMDWKSKVGIGTAILAIIASLLLVVKCQNDTIHHLKAVENSFIEQKKLIDGIVRSESSYVSKKDLETFAKNNDISLKEIKNDLRGLNSEIKGIQVIKATTPGYYGVNIPSTNSTIEREILVIKEPTNNDSPSDESISDGNGVPIGEIGFSVLKFNKKENPWDVNIFPREYKISNVLGMDDKGRHSIYSKFSIGVNGKTYDIEIDEAKFVEKYPKSKFHLYPRLFAGIDAGAYFTQASGAVSPNLQIALFNYGATKPNPDWTFLGLGLGYEVADRNLSFVFSPVSYNVGQHLPFVDNIHIRPTVMVTPTGEFAIMAGAGFGL